MQRKYTVLRLVLLASISLAGSAMAQQQPPADQTTPNQATPDQAAPVAAPPSATTSPDATPGPDTGRKSAQEEIVVTGSRVRRKDLTTPAPVTVISREQIATSSQPTIGSFLQQLPEQGGALNTNVNNGGDGSTQINLRDLGSQRTLVLVDGKRMVASGVGSGSAPVVDLNSIPTAAVERVEILKDGGSAVYGSDAIAGVVNIITRKRMDGVELNAYSGVSQPWGDARVYDINALAGAQSEKGSFMFGAGYYDQKSFFAGNRGWAANALSWDFPTAKEGKSGSPTTPKVRVNALDPSTCSGVSPLCASLLSTFGAGKKNFIFDPAHSKAGALYAQDWRVRDPNLDFYNYQSVNYLVTPSERISLFGNGEYRLADFARTYLQATYVQRTASYLIAPEPFSTVNAGVKLDKDNPFNPFKVDLPSVQRRLTDLPGRSTAYDASTYRVVLGTDGTVGSVAGPLSGWFWDTSVNYGRTYATSTNYGFLNTQKTAPGLGPGMTDATGAHCTDTTGAVIPDCIPVNLLGPPGTITPDMANQLGAYAGTNSTLWQLFTVGASLSGELFSVAADRPAALALGYEFRKEFGYFQYNPILAAGWDSDTGSPGPADTRGGFHVNEGFAELVVPVINHAPLAENVEVTGAVRGFNYNTFGSDYTYKLGARYSPIRDVTLRATYSTAFRAPNILELYQGLAAGNFESSNDPCANTHGDVGLATRCNGAPGTAGGAGTANNGVTVAQINSANGGTATLQPEKAKIGTIGLVFEPQMVRGFTLTTDFWRISMRQLIGNYGTQFILNKCYGAAGFTQDLSFCNLVTREDSTKEVSKVIDANVNIGEQLTTGIDLGAQYSLPTDVGRFLFRFNGTYLIKNDYTGPGGIYIKGAGNYDGQGVVSASGSTNFNPRVKFNTGVNYFLGGFSAGLLARFIGPLTECAPDGGLVNGSNTGPGFCYQNKDRSGVDENGRTMPYPEHNVSANWTWDALASYRLTSPAGVSTLALGVRNLANQRPPRLYNAFLSYADPDYDFVGRYIYGRVEHRF